ncbi:DUF4915 domain-containing protein [Verrucomicrobiota bacterium]
MRKSSFARHDAAWRDPAQVAGLWDNAADVDPDLLAFKTYGDMPALLSELGITLVVTREYEHVALALSCTGKKPEISYFRVPHPSGIAVDRRKGTVYLASTRNPNQVIEMKPAGAGLDRKDMPFPESLSGRLLPTRSWFFPGCLYTHDLALVGKDLHAAAVGMNAIIKIDPSGDYDATWWPACIDRKKGKPRFDRNYLQLNSIAAGRDMKTSFFSASAARVSKHLPGQPDFPVDRKGVIFSGKTREPVCRGLTRPHTARLRGKRLWVDNSGYGEVGIVSGARLETVARLPGWTRGLSFCGSTAFVGTSRVLPRFRQYAPGLDLDRSECSVCAVDTRSGNVLGRIVWPHGNQLFSVECVPATLCTGFPWTRSARSNKNMTEFFYAYQAGARKGKQG